MIAERYAPSASLIIKLRVYVIEVLLSHLCDGERA